MTYLQRLIQRSLSQAPARMLLPVSAGWNGLIDPFENTRYLPPTYPNTISRPGTKSAELGRSEQTMPTSHDVDARAYQVERKWRSPPITQHQHHQPRIPAVDGSQAASDAARLPENHSQQVPLDGRPHAMPRLNHQARPEAESRRKEMSPPRNYRHGQLAVRWLQRYVSDAVTNDRAEIGKLKSGAVRDQETRILVPRQGKVPVSKDTAASPRSLAISGPTARRHLRKQLQQETRLIIDQLTVDVVPTQSATLPHRRKAVAKKRIDDKRGKLTQAETARFGFGIGQM